ncbi:MAG: hypothetical protein VB125_05430 [Burkholderia sp.]
MGTYKHLSCEERALIHLSLERGCKLRAIAPRSLHRAPLAQQRARHWQARRNSLPGWTRRGRCGRRSNDSA